MTLYLANYQAAAVEPCIVLLIHKLVLHRYGILTDIPITQVYGRNTKFIIIRYSRVIADHKFAIFTVGKVYYTGYETTSECTPHVLWVLQYIHVYYACWEVSEQLTLFSSHSLKIILNYDMNYSL